MSRYFALRPVFSKQKSYYGKAYIHEYKDYYVLYSYNTPVCVVTNADNVVHRTWGSYSKTTMIHINDFLKQLGIVPVNGLLTKSEWENMIVERGLF